MKRLMMLGAAMMAAAFQANGGIAYQGSLYSSKGEAVASRSVAVVFRLYDGETATAPIWARKINVRTDAEGYFNVELDDTQGSWAGTGSENTMASALYGVLKNEKTLYLGLTVEGSTGEILPRQKLLPVPEASFANDTYQTTDEPFTVGDNLRGNGGGTFKGDVTFEGATAFNGGVTVSEQARISDAVISNHSSFAVGACYVMPTNTIIMWWGDAKNPPAGWVLCDGNNGTPDLCGSFPLGGGTDATKDHQKGTTGGAATVRLGVEHLPSHTHRFANDVNVGEAGTSDNKPFPEQGEYSSQSGYRDDNDNYLYYYDTSTTGGGEAHNNMPPYLTVNFIMRVE